MNVEQTTELLKAANPVPEEDGIEQPYETSAAYLAALEQRSEDIRFVERGDSNPTPIRTNRRRRLAIAVAAVVVAVSIGYGLVLLNTPGGDVIDGIDLGDPLSVLPGTWDSTYGAFTFASDLGYIVTENGIIKEMGTYRVIGTLVTLTSDAGSAECPGATDTLNITIDSADQITMFWEAVGCESHYVLDCFLPGGEVEGCGRLDRT